MFLVTGAAGKTGKAIIQALVAKGESVRALVFRHNQVALLNQLGVKEVVVGNMLNRESVNAAVADVRALYHICPNMHPDEVAIGQIVVACAKSAGCERFVYHSVLHPQIQAMPHHWHKLLVKDIFSNQVYPVRFSNLPPTCKISWRIGIKFWRTVSIPCHMRQRHG